MCWRFMFSFLKNISPVEIGAIVVIVLVVFGTKAFISLGKTGGETLKEIKKIKKNFSDAVSDEEPQKSKKGVEN